MKYWQNFTSTAYTFANLTCKLQPIFLGKSKMSFFNNIIHMYFGLFTLSENKTNCNHDCEVNNQCDHTTLWNAELIHLMEGFPPNASSSEKSSFCVTFVALESASCVVWQLECLASSATASVQSDYLLHGYTISSLFTTDQSHCPPVHVLTSSCRNSSVLHIGTWYTRFCIMSQMQLQSNLVISPLNISPNSLLANSCRGMDFPAFHLPH